MAKVRLADLIDAEDRHSYWQANFNRVSSKRVDFVVCDPLFRPVIAIELDDASDQRKDGREGDDVVDNLFATVRLPLLRVPVRRDYDVDELRLLLLQKLE